MFKSFFIKALKLIILVLLLVQINVYSALAQETESSQSINSPSSNIQQQDTQMPNESETSTQENLTNNNQQEEITSSPSRLSKNDRPQDPYAKYYESMKKFNAEVYGKDQ